MPSGRAGSRSSCVQFAQGQAALQWPHAKLRAHRHLTPVPVSPVALPLPAVPSPQAGRMRGDEEPGTALGLQGGSLAVQREVCAVSDGVLGSARL